MHLAARRNTMAPAVFFAPSSRPSTASSTAPSIIITSPKAYPSNMHKRPRTADDSTLSPKTSSFPSIPARSPSYDDTSIHYTRTSVSPLLPPKSGSSIATSAPPISARFLNGTGTAPLLPTTEDNSASWLSLSPPHAPHHDKGFFAVVRGRLWAKPPVRSLRIRVDENKERLERGGKVEKWEKKERQERIKRAYAMGDELWRECERDNWLIRQRMERDAVTMKNI